MAYITNYPGFKFKDLDLTEAFKSQYVNVTTNDAIIEGMFLWELCKSGIPMTDIMATEEDERIFGKIASNYQIHSGLNKNLSEVLKDPDIISKDKFTENQNKKLLNIFLYLANLSFNKENAIKEITEYFKCTCKK